MTETKMPETIKVWRDVSDYLHVSVSNGADDDTRYANTDTLTAKLEGMRKDYAGLSHDETDMATGWNAAIDAAINLIKEKADV